jgi:hypothetical protein
MDDELDDELGEDEDLDGDDELLDDDDKDDKGDEDDDDDDEEVADLDEDEEEDEEESLEVLLGPDAADDEVRGDDTRDGLRAPATIGEGEFTCRSCFLVKRRAQLADEEALICLDCA